MTAKYKLYQFRHSHFSEKVRWALKFKGVPFEKVNLVRGPHEKIARRLGAPDSTVPILETPDHEIIQDSTAILDWLELHFPDRSSLNPQSVGDCAEAKRLEEFFDETLGYHCRRFLYSCLIEHPKVVASIMLQGKPKFWHVVFPLMFIPMRRGMIRKLELGPGAAQESEAELNKAFDEIDARIKDGAQFLVAGQFTRADITAAALLSVLTWPPEHDFDWPETALVPPELNAFRERVSSRPFYNWALNLYKTHRAENSR